MIIWIFCLALWIHTYTASQTESENGARDNHLQVVWPLTTEGLLSDVTLSLPYDSSSSVQPFFDDSASYVNVSVQFGTDVVLHCRVSDLSEQTTVSWLRRQDGQLRLVAVGLDVYSGDERFSAALLEPNDWTLSLRDAQKSDEGVYECQVSSHPPLVHALHLHVIVPLLQIWDERGIPIRNKFYNAGSTIELKCSISKVPKPSHFILWKHGTSILNYDITRGGISVKTDMMADGVKSTLFIANVGPLDSGNYTCHLQDVAETSVSVDVLTGETPAAMQTGASSSQFPTTLYIFSLWLTTVLNLR